MKVSDKLAAVIEEFRISSEDELASLREVLPQYVIDHTDRRAYAKIDRDLMQAIKNYERLTHVLVKTLMKVTLLEKRIYDSDIKTRTNQ